MDDIVHDETDLQSSDETSATLFDILCQHVDGDALMILKSVVGCRGFEAWQRLHRKYNPKTLARGLRLLMAVVNLGSLKNVGDVEAGITLWEEKVKQLASQFKEELSDKMKMAILTNAMPSGVKDHVL